MPDNTDLDTTPKFFKIQGSSVAGDSGQEDANHFAADFQGLRHFGQKIAEALDLEGPWHGAFREADFSHFWATETNAGESGVGVMAAKRIPLVELFDLVTQD
jgi:hypothetical protein